MKANLIRVAIPIFIIVGTIYCIRNGVQVAKMPELNKEPDSILLFYVISLFTFGAKDFGAPVAGPWFLVNLMWLFYFIAPLITLVAAADLLSAIRPIFLKYIKIFRPYYLIIGYGRIGRSALESIQTVIGNNTYCIILDRDVSESENGLAVLFENVIYLKVNVSDADQIIKFISGKCRGVFILTDEELLNLRIYYQLRKVFHQTQDSKIFNFVRIRSLELHNRRSHIFSRNNEHNTGTNRESNQLINIHAVTPDLLFNPQLELDKFNKTDKIYIDYLKQVRRFESWMNKKYDCFLFWGFGSFSSFILNNLLEYNCIQTGSRIIIIDKSAQQNWENYKMDYPISLKSIVDLRIEIYNTDIENTADTNIDLSSKIGTNTLSIFATNKQELNVQMASFIYRKFQSSCTIDSLIRTKYMDFIDPTLLDLLIVEKQWVVVPTYSWIKLYFESKLLKLSDES